MAENLYWRRVPGNYVEFSPFQWPPPRGWTKIGRVDDPATYAIVLAILEEPWVKFPPPEEPAP